MNPDEPICACGPTAMLCVCNAPTAVEAQRRIACLIGQMRTYHDTLCLVGRPFTQEWMPADCTMDSLIVGEQAKLFLERIAVSAFRRWERLMLVELATSRTETQFISLRDVGGIAPAVVVSSALAPAS